MNLRKKGGFLKILKNFLKVFFLMFFLIFLISIYGCSKNNKISIKEDIKTYSTNQTNYTQTTERDEISLKNVKTNEVIEINEANLLKNFFKTFKTDPKHDWLSVAPVQYNKQYYVRDTMVSFMGGIEANEIIKQNMVYAIDWFGNHMDKDGYIPIWFQETDQLNVYYFAPYNLTSENGGIRQLDHELMFIDSIYLYFKKSNDFIWFKNNIGFVNKVQKYLEGKTNNYLLVGDYSDFAGNDWADQIRRSGKSTFINAYWYKVMKEIAEMQEILGEKQKSKQIQEYAENIKKEFNNNFWVESEPRNCPKGKIGHYLAWKNDKGTFDYFEVDSNTLAVAVGLADKEKSLSIMRFINNNFNYFVNSYGATRVVCGFYGTDATKMEPGVSQNGGYWYLPSYYLTMALVKTNDISKIKELWNRIDIASRKFEKQGLAEWYYENDQPGGAMNYSWSLSYPLFLASIIENKNAVYKLK